MIPGSKQRSSCGGLVPGLLAAALAAGPVAAATPCETAGDPTAGQAASAAADPAPGTPDPRELPGGALPPAAGGGGGGLRGGGVPWPRPPDVVVRDGQGRVTVRAVRLAAGLQLDGLLDEPLYDCVRAIGDFIQLMPDEGAPATEKTEAWIAFDAESIYNQRARLGLGAAGRLGGQRDAARHAPAP